MDSNEKYNDIIKGTSFIAGIIWSKNDPTKFITHPISSTFDGILYGSLTSIGAGIVGVNLPEKAKPYFAGLIGISAGLYLINQLYKKYTNNINDNDDKNLIRIYFNTST